ncbi:hypothetical protein CANCADRAFT_84386 [Tortispora caseinolytica NRRL Y-17796]|uniref:Metallo-beta-lactamase domain-containing protein n=1 Tax=Tortispora caseinolytica NRRL Y-17796 TaxID=767744 RepID=A0A1E4TKK7_9ASCO|nr:hypothetical protein CANCADRAFT_84386 [Tortispora caseinolytica NRRL Y-17796]
MGYGNPEQAYAEQINENLTVVNAPFKVGDRMDVGARATFLRVDSESGESKLVVFAPGPISEASASTIEKLGNGKIDYLVVPNIGHTMCLKQYIEHYPGVHVVCNKATAELIPEHEAVTVLETSHANREVAPSELGIAGIDDKLSFLFVPSHLLKEVAIYDKTDKALIFGDLFMNVPGHSQYKKADAPGWTGLLNKVPLFLYKATPDSRVQPLLLYYLLYRDTPLTREFVKLIKSLEIESFIMCHGDILSGEYGWKVFNNLFHNFT